METLRSKSDEKKMVWSGYGHKAQKIVRKKFRWRLVRMRSPVRIWVAAPKIPENFGFRGFFVAKSYFAGWPKISDPHRDPHAEMRQRKQWTQERRTGSLPSCPAYFSFCPYRTCSIKLPMVWAASSCFCLVAWV